MPMRRLGLLLLVLSSPLPAIAQGLIIAATQAKDLTFPTAPSVLSADDVRMALLKPEGIGPFPAIVLHHQCAGLRTKGGPNRSMATWAQAAVRQGFVVLVIDSLGPRDVDLVCYGPKGGVNFARGARDAMQAADHLRTLPFVDKRRIAHVGFSWGAMVGLLVSNTSWRSVLPGGEGFTAAVAVYPGCFTIRPPTAPQFEIVQKHIDRPALVLMGDEDTETPAEECVAKLQAVKAAGAPVEWHVFRNATHCWDCEHLNGFSKQDVRGTHVTYRYDAGATQETRRRIFDFLEKALSSTR
jgi:dienelactone hydrolase